MSKGQIALKRLSEDEARELLEGLRWANGVACPHCGNCDQARITKRHGQVYGPRIWWPIHVVRRGRFSFIR